MLLAVVVLTAACRNSSAPHPSSRSAHDDAAGKSTATATTRVEAGIGIETIKLLSGPTTVIVARLGTENANKAEQTKLTDARRIGGHPIVADERTLSADQASQLAGILTDDSDYLDVMRRCENKTWLGARFGKLGSGETVEVVLGRPCDQLIFFWFDEGDPQDWGSVVTPAMSAAFEKLVRGN